MAMKFLNRFSIEEDDQFEIQNFYEMKFWLSDEIKRIVHDVFKEFVSFNQQETD